MNTIDPSSKGVIPGWEKALYSVDNVHRYINEETGQVYLEKVPGSSTGCIKWRMDFGCSGLLVDEVTMRLKCVEDYGGEIMITLMGIPGHKRLRYAIGEKKHSFYIIKAVRANCRHLGLQQREGRVGELCLSPQIALDAQTKMAVVRRIRKNGKITVNNLGG